MSDEDRENVDNTARTLVRGGYEPLESIEQSLIDVVEDSSEDRSERDIQLEVRNALVRAVTELTKEQTEWPVLTDYDRLKAALDTLETEGIVARENFTCCGTCGAAEIGAEIEDFAVETGRPAKGYVFFHQQDTERAVEGQGLYFNYGNAGEEWSQEKSVAIGKRLTETLSSAGLKPDWNGSIDQRVFVSLDWKRRWTGSIPKPVKRWFF